MGPEKNQQLPQNQGHPQPPIKTKAPLDVVFVTANQTGSKEKLVIKGPKQVDLTDDHPQQPRHLRRRTPRRQLHDRHQQGRRRSHLQGRPLPGRSKNDLLLP